MKPTQSRWHAVVVLWCVTFGLGGLLPTVYAQDTPKAITLSPGDIYKHHPEYPGAEGANDWEVETMTNGTRIKALTDHSSASLIAPLQADPKKPIQPQQWFIDALGSKNIKIVVNKKVGYTEYAGLKFHQSAIVNIWKDGTIEVDREGVEAVDKNKTLYLSQRRKIDEKESIVMVQSPLKKGR